MVKRSKLELGCAVAALVAGMAPAAALAQDRTATPAPSQSAPSQSAPSADEMSEDIVVTGELRGAVQSDIPPEVQLSPADVRAYGVPTISDLITELAPQTGSGRGRGGEQPVILLNGRRISSFAEIRDMPTEAIERVDILPEEVALKYGYSANQKVVNIVLRQRFRALTTELEGRMPTAGGMAGGRGQANILKIARDSRINLDVQYSGASGLLESERDVTRASTGLFDTRGNVAGIGGAQIDPALSALAGAPVTVAGVPASAATGAPSLAAFGPTANLPNSTDLAPYRTLVSPNQQLTINGVYSRNLGKIAASLNVRLEDRQSQSLLGLPSTTLTLPATNDFSPFANDVQLYRYLGNRLPIGRDTKSQTAHGGFSLNGDGLPWGKDWRWSFTGNYDRVTSRTVTDGAVDVTTMQALLNANSPTFNPFATIAPTLAPYGVSDTANSTSSVGSLDMLVSGPLVKLPAGDLHAAIRVSGRTSDFESESLRAGVARSGDTSRDSGSVQGNFDLPIASRRRGVLDAIGDLSLNGNIEVERLSDFGTLVTTGYGVNWSPIPQVRFLASVTDEEGAPSANQLGDPVLSTANVRVFDYVRGESVDVTSISGGNPLLTADNRHVLKLGLNLRPFDAKDFSLSAEYVTSTTRNQISSFPSPTAAVEAAFPTRFVRDGTGRLVSIDTRSVNFDRAERSQLRWGFNFSVPLSSGLQKKLAAMREEFMAALAKSRETGQPLPEKYQKMQEEFQRNRQRGQNSLFGNGGGPGGPGGAPGAGARGPGGGGGGGGGPRGGFGGRNGGLAGRIQFSLYHTWHFKEEITVRPGLPVIDLLDGGATGNRGGQPEHEIEAQAGISKDGLGARLIGNWKSGTTVYGGLTGADRLDFGSQSSVNLRLFADLGQQLSLVRKHRWVRGMRVTFSVDNLFDQRQRVTDANGVIPSSYQPDLLDPQGRVVRLSIRKLFF
jgi:hypothetical protein